MSIRAKASTITERLTFLGASTVTNVPTSVIVGNVGAAPGSSITGFLSSPGVATSDPQVAGGTVLPLADLAGLVLSPGVYTVPAGTTNLSGALTLDGGGNANAAWVFQFASTLITSPNSLVSVINTGAGAGLFWNVGSSATIDVNTTFLGNILASASIALNTTATVLCGRALADTAAVTPAAEQPVRRLRRRA